jgi:hypothetical protein
LHRTRRAVARHGESSTFGSPPNVTSARRPLVNASPGLKTRVRRGGRLNGASRYLSLTNPQSAINRRRTGDGSTMRRPSAARCCRSPFNPQFAIRNPQSTVAVCSDG